MVSKDMVRGLPLFDKRGDDLIFLMQFPLGQVYTGPGRAKRFTVLPVSKYSIVRILMGYGTMVDLLGTAIAYVRSLIEPGAALFLKAFTGLVTGRTGSTLDAAYDQFPASIGLLTMIAMNAEVMGIIKRAFMIPVRYTARLHFLGDSRGILAKESGYVLKGCAFIQFRFNIFTIIKSKVFLITRNEFTHYVLLLLLSEGVFDLIV